MNWSPDCRQQEELQLQHKKAKSDLRRRILSPYACFLIHENDVTVTAHEATVHASKCCMPNSIFFFTIHTIHVITIHSASSFVEVLFYCFYVSRREDYTKRKRRQNSTFYMINIWLLIIPCMLLLHSSGVTCNLCPSTLHW
jgi:hypothetical protein